MAWYFWLLPKLKITAPIYKLTHEDEKFLSSHYEDKMGALKTWTRIK